MATETQTTIVQENPEIEAYRIGLLQDVQRFIRGQITGQIPSIDPVTGEVRTDADGNPIMETVTRAEAPAFQVAGLTPMQQQAALMAQEGIGMYQPYLQQAVDMGRQGAGAITDYGLSGIQEGLGAYRGGQDVLSQAASLAAAQRAQPYEYQTQAAQGIRDSLSGIYDSSTMGQQDLGRAAQQTQDVLQMGRGDLGRAVQEGYGQRDVAQQALYDAAARGQAGLAGLSEQFDPSTQVDKFFNPFETQVVDRALQDIRRQGDIQAQGLRARAAARGAFGGSRQAVAEQEQERNVLDQQAKTAAQLRQQGFSQASAQAQKAFEDARKRQAQEALAGFQMGSGAATQAGQFGLQTAEQALRGATAGGQLGLGASGQLGQFGLQGANLGMQAGQSGLGAYRGGQDVLSQAASLAAAQRAQPYEYQTQAAQGIRDSLSGIYDSSTMGQQDLGRAAQQTQDVLQMGRGDLGRAVQEGYGQRDVAQQALYDAAARGQAGLAGLSEQFDPSTQVDKFFNPFETQVVDRALQDIRRQGDIQAQGLRARAAARGAFGGSRQAVAEQEQERNVLDQQAKTAAQLRQQGFSQASAQAQKAFEDARKRQAQEALAGFQMGSGAATQAGQFGLQTAEQALRGATAGGQLGLGASGQLGQFGLQGANLGMQAGQSGLGAANQLGQLGLQFGQLGQGDVNQLINLASTSGQLGSGIGSLAGQGANMGVQLAGLGMDQAKLGQAAQDMYGTDIQRLTALGGQEMAVQQAILDAQRQSNLQRYQQPFQLYGFLSDMYKGTPSSQATTQMMTSPNPSTAQQIAGLGIAGLGSYRGAQSMGLFG